MMEILLVQLRRGSMLIPSVTAGQWLPEPLARLELADRELEERELRRVERCLAMFLRDWKAEAGRGRRRGMWGTLERHIRSSPWQGQLRALFSHIAFSIRL